MRAGTKGRRQAAPVRDHEQRVGPGPRSAGSTTSTADRVLDGALKDDEWFAYVCGLEEGDDYRDDEKVWKKANPNLGVSISESYLRRQVREAAGMPAQQSLVRRLNFCEWTENANPWVEMDVWNRNAGELRPLAGRSCFGGLDLSHRPRPLGQPPGLPGYRRDVRRGLPVLDAARELPETGPDRPRTV
jgi:hypothetical protein